MNGPGVKRNTFDLWGNVLREPGKAVRIGGTIDASVTDPGSEDPYVLRPGLIMARKASDGKFYPFGANFKLVSDEEVGTGDGATVEFALDNDHVVPYSETIVVDGTALSRGIDYRIDYIRGVVVFFAPPANGAAITATYLHDETLDGTEIPVGIIENYVYMRGDDGTPDDVNTQIVISGWIANEGDLKALQERSLAFAKAYLSKHGFLGVSDPEAAV